MSNIKQALKRALFGIPIGIAIGATISLAINIAMQGSDTHTPYSSLEFYTTSYIVSAIIGALYAGSSIIWELEKWSLLKQVTTHFFLTITTHITCAIIASWVPFELSAILIYIGIYVALYLLIFFIIYIVQKKQVNKVNSQLQK